MPRVVLKTPTPSRSRSPTLPARGREKKPPRRDVCSFRGLAAMAREHSLEPAANDRFRFADDPGDKLGAARNIVDQALNLPRRPDAVVGIARGIDHFAAGAGDQIADLLEGRAFFFHRHHLRSEE